MFMWTWWQKRGKKPVAIEQTSSFGRPLARRA
jgi:hypothetical protein